MPYNAIMAIAKLHFCVSNRVSDNLMLLQKCTFVNALQKGRCIFLNFWQVFTELCAKNGQNATTVIENLGLSKGNATRWKNGGGPTLATAAKIAQHFGVSLDTLVPQSNDTTQRDR